MAIPSRRTLLRGAGVVGAAIVLPDTGLRAQSVDTTRSVTRGTPRPGSLWTLHGDGSDTTSLWREALRGIAGAGAGAIRVTGDHLITRELTLPDVEALEILGEGVAVLRKGEPGREFRLFTNRPPQTAGATLRVENIRFVGDWDAVSSLGGDGCRCIGVSGYDRVTFRGLSAEAFRNMTFTADDCDEVLVDGCLVRRSARDAINLTGSRFVKVTNCTIQHVWDDAIAVHVPRDVTDDTRRWEALITGNQILQSHGIKVLGGRDVTIADNQIVAPNNYGIYLGRDAFWREGGVPHVNVVVAGNIIGEMLDSRYLPGQGDVGAGIILVDGGGRPRSVRIQGNIVSKYKPSGPGVHYADWGFAAQADERRLFTADGWIDPELVHGHQGLGIGVRILCANALDSTEIAVESNTFANLAEDVQRRVED